MTAHISSHYHLTTGLKVHQNDSVGPDAACIRQKIPQKHEQSHLGGTESCALQLQQLPSARQGRRGAEIQI